MRFRDAVKYTIEVMARESEDRVAEWLWCLTGSDKVRRSRTQEAGPSRESRLRWADSGGVAAEVMAELSDPRSDARADLVAFGEGLQAIAARDPKLGRALAKARDANLEVIAVLSDPGPESVDPLPREGRFWGIVE